MVRYLGSCPLSVVQAEIKRKFVHNGPETGHKESILTDIYIYMHVHIDIYTYLVSTFQALFVFLDG